MSLLLTIFLDYVAGKEVEDAYVVKVRKAVVRARANKDGGENICLPI